MLAVWSMQKRLLLTTLDLVPKSIKYNRTMHYGIFLWRLCIIVNVCVPSSVVACVEGTETL